MKKAELFCLVKTLQRREVRLRNLISALEMELMRRPKAKPISYFDLTGAGVTEPPPLPTPRKAK